MVVTGGKPLLGEASGPGASFSNTNTSGTNQMYAVRSQRKSTYMEFISLDPTSKKTYYYFIRENSRWLFVGRFIVMVTVVVGDADIGLIYLKLKEVVIIFTTVL